MGLFVKLGGIILQSGAARRAYLIVTLIITMSTIFLTAYYLSEKKELLIKDKQLYLLKIAATLDRQLDKKELYLEVARLNALPLSQDEKALVINKYLQPMLMNISAEYPDCSLGIYAKGIERVVAVGPHFTTELLQYQVIRPESLKTYETQNPFFAIFTSSTGGDGISVLNYTYPVMYDGQVIGHTWANLKTEDVDNEIWGLFVTVITYAVSRWIIAMLVVYLVFYKFYSALRKLAFQIGRQDDNRDNFRSFPELLPILDTIITLRQTLKEEYQENAKINAQLISNRQTIADILDGINDGFYVLDQDNRVMYVNLETAKMLGKKRIDIIGKKIEDVFYAAQQKDDLVYGAKVRAINEAIYYEIYVPRVDKWYGKKTYPLTNGCIAISIRDITENHKMQHQLTRLDRLNIVGQIAAGISHEIRNPMTTVRGYLQWFSKKDYFKEYSSQFQLMVAELDRANYIISEFLSVAKDKEITMIEHNLKDIVTSILPLLESDALLESKTIMTELQEHPYLLLDENEIKQLILNLVRNALEASGPGQSVTIRTNVNADTKEVYLEVSDHGIGIPPEILSKIGTPFLTTKERGTGLGLSVCYGIVSRHHAKIEVTSTDKGTTFKVFFPINRGL